MHISKEMLLSAVGLMFTVALIFIGYSVFSRSVDAATFFGRQQDDTIQALEEYPITKYDGYEIRGSMAINLIKEVIGSYDGITVEVITTTMPEGFTVTDSSQYALFRDLSSAYYINPIVQYLVTAERDGNGVITSIQIEYVDA